jgi:hypothetical protein
LRFFDEKHPFHPSNLNHPNSKMPKVEIAAFSQRTNSNDKYNSLIYRELSIATTVAHQRLEALLLGLVGRFLG